VPVVIQDDLFPLRGAYRDPLPGDPALVSNCCVKYEYDNEQDTYSAKTVVPVTRLTEGSTSCVRIHSPRERPLKGQNRHLLVCCVGTIIDHVKEWKFCRDPNQ
jgi:hypothetical protein